MSAIRPRLVIVRDAVAAPIAGRSGGASPESLDEDALASMRGHFDVVEAPDLATATRIASGIPGSVILGGAGRLAGAVVGLQHAARIVEALGQGVGLVHESGEVLWMNAALSQRDAEMLRRFADGCVEAIRSFNAAAAAPPASGAALLGPAPAGPLGGHGADRSGDRTADRGPEWLSDRGAGSRGAGGAPSRRMAFRGGGSWFELIVSPAPSVGEAGRPADEGASSGRGATEDSAASADETAPPPPRIDAVVGVLWDITASRRMQERLDSAQASGEELLRIDAGGGPSVTPVDRLRALERAVIHGLHAVVGHEAFEVRLLDRASGKLELVIALGIRPLSIGESMFATAQGNGITGLVAATGRSYICPDTRRDPLYRSGLDEARSSLTVPLLSQERVVGVLNLESAETGRFSDDDRSVAELYGRYIAQALTTLELVVRERSTTRDELAQAVAGELRQPMDDIAAQVTALRARLGGDAEAAQRLDQIMESLAGAKARLETSVAGPQTLLGVAEALADDSSDAVLAGRRVLVADDEAMIRQTILAILSKKGAIVDVCRDGLEAIERIRAAAEERRAYDLVVSDVRMPDRNGYEVFRASKDASPQTPVILMTGFGYDPHHSIVRSSQEGLHCFLFKPFQVSQLLDEVRKALTAG
ncbi:MAG TPA: response regulator [Phycisphaerales bacterium]|nr:response regulator [Phycisphaerales bacterium]HMP38418.1 response regulator [Phycisphaerales bacterium]